MTARDFFKSLLSTDANCPVDIYAHKYSMKDLLKFAEAYHEAKEKQKSLIIESFERENNEAKLKEELIKYEDYKLSFNLKALDEIISTSPSIKAGMDSEWDVKEFIDEYLKQRNI